MIEATPARSAGDVCETCDPRPDPPRRSVTLRASVFFDGTLNSRANTRSYAGYTEAQKTASVDTSYANDYSNVSRLEEVLHLPHTGFDHSYKLYIEGIGTTDGASDSGDGKALGTGSTGVPAKVERGPRVRLQRDL